MSDDAPLIRPALEGELSAFMMADVFAILNMLKKTGILIAEHDGMEKQIHWLEGEVVFAVSSSANDTLGEFLIRHGRINRGQSEAAFRGVAAGRRQGRVLIEMGLITPRQLWWAVKNQVLEIIYSLFHWRTGHFIFRDGATFPDEKIQLSESAANLIMEGMRRMDEWPRIREKIPSDDLVPVTTMPFERARGEIHFADGEAELFQALDGVRTIRDLVSQSELDEFETLRSLYSFICAGIIKIKGARGGRSYETDEDDTEPMRALMGGYDHLFRQLFAALLAHLGSGEARTVLNQIISNSLGGHPLMHNLKFNDEGLLDQNSLLANAAELPHTERLAAIDEGLGQLISFCLFEVSKRLGRADKDAAFSAMARARETLEKVRGKVLEK